MRVLAVHPSADGYGADRMLLEAVRGLRARAVEVTVSIPDRGPLIDQLLDLGVTVVPLDMPVLRKALLRPAGLLSLVGNAPVALLRAVRLVRRTEPDVVYVNTVTVPLWILAARLARRPAVCHVREAEEGLPRLLELVLSAPLLAASRLVANSHHTAQRLGEAWPRLRRRTAVVYNGFAAPAAEPRPPSRTGRRRLLVVGRLSPRKGQQIALTALADLVAAGHDVELELVGTEFPGYEWFVAELHDLARRLGVADRVIFSGYEPDTGAAYVRSEIVLVPSLVEPFGNVAVEAQLAGRPVVASATGGLTEIVRAGVSGALVPAGDARALGRTIGELLLDEPRRAALARAALDSAQQRFGLERYHDELLAELELAAGGATSSAGPAVSRP